MSGEINWAEAIEAVHEDGRVVGAFVEDSAVPPQDMTWGVRCNDRRYMHVENDGTPYSRMSDIGGWRIRNVAQAPETTRTAPSGGEVGPEVLHGFVRAVAALNLQEASLHGTDCWKVGEQAKMLRALLTEPVDADLVEAREVCANVTGEDAHEQNGFVSGHFDNGEIMLCALAAIKRGRALATTDSRNGGE